MFWRFGGYSNVSKIDTLLDKQSTTLEDLLEEQDLVQELKSHHPKLIEFLRDDNHLHTLLKYVVAPGPEIAGDADNEDDDEPNLTEEQEEADKRRLKYAFVACEILSCETWSITEAVMSNPEFLKEFWEFLRRPAPLDPLQAGYFTKVNEALLEKKTEEMLEFFKSLPDVIPAILQHVDCPMVMDLLLKIISLEKSEGGVGIVEWLHDQDLIPHLLSSLSSDCNSSTQTSAGDFLKAIITISANAAQNEQSCIGPNSLTRQLVSERCIQQLIKHMLQGGNPLTVGVGIIIEVIRKNNSDYDPENGLNPDAPPTTHDPIFLGTLLRQFAKHVPDFMNLILSPRHTVTDGEGIKVVDRGLLKSAWGQEIEPLGFDRFKTCELMAELLHCSNMGLLNESGSEEFVRARDEERERLRAAGKLTSQKQLDDSTIDISLASSKFESSIVPSTGASTEELRTQNTGDEDGFENVSVVEEDRNSSTRNNIDDLVDEPLTPTKPSIQAQNGPNSPAHGLDENVRRLSLEDTEMTSDIPDISVDPPVDSKLGGMSPHPDDKPAPLFAKYVDPNKTPTPASPEPSTSPQGSQDVSMPDIAPNPSTLEQEVALKVRSDEKASPIVGDYLKTMFVEHKVVPTILSFFFRFPWNNFLHNVVYDVVQQVFNGPMDRGFNKVLAFDLFETGRITDQIISGQRRSEEAERVKNMRLGYMGHLTLVAEEVVKFGERHPKEALSEDVQGFIYGKAWEQYVNKTLAETRDRDNAILGGVRPENGLGPRQAVLNAVNASSGFTGSNALAQVGLMGGQQGLDSIDLSNNGSATSSSYTTAGSSLLSGFGSSSDDEDEDMEDDHDDAQARAVIQLSAADTGVNADQPMPLIPPPPAPLILEPSRARRRLADRLALREAQQEQEAQEPPATELGLDDPFAALGDNDEQGHDYPFSLDEEAQDITSFGKRRNVHTSNNDSDSTGYLLSRGIDSLLSSGQHKNKSYMRGSLDDEFSSDSGSDDGGDHTAVEARTSLERRPLDIDDDDDDEEMGDMVAPTDEANSSDDEPLTSVERQQLGFDGGRDRNDDDDERVSEFDGQADEDHEDDVVEIPMPKSKRRSRGSLG